MSRSPYTPRTDPTDPFQRLNYGGTLGGPIRRDRTHYFLSYERQDRDTNTASTVTLPSRTALFAPGTRQFLAANGIDVSLFPATQGRYRLTRPEFVNVHKISARVDEQINPRHSLTFRTTSDPNDAPSGHRGTLLDYSGSFEFSRDTFANMNHKWILSSNRLNEFSVQTGQRYIRNQAVFPGLVGVNVQNTNISLGGDDNEKRTDYITQVQEAFTWRVLSSGTGEHIVKSGGAMKVFRSSGYFDSNFRGTFTFPSLQRFIDGRPSRFTRNQGDSQLSRPEQDFGVYVQDDWRPKPSLTLNLGLRYDYENASNEALREINGNGDTGISRQKTNFAPRAGFAWSPRASTRTVVYGGSGIYYDKFLLTVLSNARFTPPKVVNVRIDNPPWPDPGIDKFPPSSLSVIDPDLRTPYNWKSQLGIRRELSSNLGIDASIVFNRGYDQIARINTNAGIEGTADINGSNPVRPDPTIGDRNLSTNRGVIRYKALLVDVRKRLSRRFQGGIAYTLARSLNNATATDTGVQVPSHQELSFGPDTQDRRHRIRSHIEAELPWNVRFGAIVEFYSREPFSVTAARDLNGDGITGDYVNEILCRNIACPGYHYSRNSVYQLSTEQANRLRGLFGLDPIARFENNPRYFNTDVSLQKSVRLGTQRVRITAEGINVFNTPQRNVPNSSVTNDRFGQYTSVQQPRAVQFTMQFSF